MAVVTDDYGNPLSINQTPIGDQPGDYPMPTTTQTPGFATTWTGGLSGTSGDQEGDYPMPTTGQNTDWASKSSSFDLNKFLDNLFGSKSKLLSGIENNPLQALLMASVIGRALTGGNSQSVGGYKGPGINMGMTAARQPIQQPTYKPYSGLATMGRQFFSPVTYAAEGGLMGLAAGRYLRGDTDGMADKIPSSIDGQQPAKLSHGEFVVPADVVSHLGNGNSDAGADVLYKMMDKVRKARTGTTKQGKQINPEKFTPGGQAYKDGGAVAFPDGGPVPGTTTETNLSSWAGPYVTDYLSKAQALSNMPYQAYQGPLVAGASPLQQQAFGGLSALVGGGGYGGFGGFMPNMQTPPRQKAMGTWATDTMKRDWAEENPLQPLSTPPADQQESANQPEAMAAPQYQPQYQPMNTAPAAPWQYGLGSAFAAQAGLGSFTQPNTAEAFMSPYIQNVIDVQQREAKRQADIAATQRGAQYAKAGAFGGARQAIENAEANRNLQTQLGNIQATGLQSAYQQAQQQYNAERNAQLQAAMNLGQLGGAQYGTQLSGLSALLGAGATQYGQEQAGITALQNEYNKQIMWPYQQLQFQQSMMQGLPVSTASNIQNLSALQNMGLTLDELSRLGSFFKG